MRAWAALVPLAAYLAIALTLHRRLGGWRVPLLAAAVVWGVVLTLITEVLSRWHGLTWPGVLAAWLAVLGGASVVARARRRGPVMPPGAPLDAASRALLGLTAALALAVGVVAVSAPPNTYDSLTYHMSRVAHWAQNGSVEPYPTAVLRQLYQSPAAEFVILHLQILTGGDRFANLVQWSAMVGSLVAASLVVRHLGGAPAAQALAAVIVATVPMGVLQASSTQNDYVAAFWLIATVAIGLAPAARPTSGRAWLVAVVGGALGLAILTKPTAYLIGAPFAALVVLRWARTDGVRRATLAAAAIVLVAGALNAGHYARNVAVFGSPLGPRDDSGYEYGAVRPRPLLVMSTAVRNVALHLATPSEWLTRRIEHGIRRAHVALGADPDDARVTWRGERFALHAWRPHEDSAGNPLHLLLIGAALGAVVARRRRHRLVVAYAAALPIAWLLFSAALKWQPWHSRLQLAIFVLGAPLAALVFGGRTGLRTALAVALLLGALPAVLWNETRPLAGPASILRRDRTQLYFVTVPGGMAPYADAARTLRELDCTTVGLGSSGGDMFEYPVWVLARSLRRPVRIEHVGVSPPSPRAGHYIPCAVVAWNELGDLYAAGDVLYSRVWGSNGLSVYAVQPWPFLTRLERLARSGEHTAGAPSPAVRIAVAADTVRIGRRVSLRVDVRRAAEGPPLALYAGLMLPDRVQVTLFTSTGAPTPPSSAAHLRVLVPRMALPAGPSDTRVVLLDGLVPPTVPPGTYRVFAAVAPASRERSPDADDILAADVRSLDVRP
jgi:hypothetical protein